MRCLGKCGLQAQVFMGSGEYEFQKMKNEVWEGSVVICRHVVLLKGDSSAIVVTTMGCGSQAAASSSFTKTESRF